MSSVLRGRLAALGLDVQYTNILKLPGIFCVKMLLFIQ
jgi:hypothetical protein